jgi:hypothetical protein
MIEGNHIKPQAPGTLTSHFGLKPNNRKAYGTSFLISLYLQATRPIPMESTLQELSMDYLHAKIRLTVCKWRPKQNYPKTVPEQITISIVNHDLD